MWNIYLPLMKTFYPPKGKIRDVRMRRKEDFICLVVKIILYCRQNRFQQRRKTLEIV
jgi:hypothetical protein